jgi:hypothetical protein
MTQDSKTAPDFDNAWLIKSAIEDMIHLKHPPGCEGGNWDCAGCSVEGKLHELANNLGVEL